jgi:hypothetical protein
LLGRLLIIERKDARRWGFDPTADPIPHDREKDAEASSSGVAASDGNEISSPPNVGDVAGTEKVHAEVLESPALAKPHLSLLGVLVELARSPRALVALFCSITNAYGTSDSFR